MTEFISIFDALIKLRPEYAGWKWLRGSAPLSGANPNAYTVLPRDMQRLIGDYVLHRGPAPVSAFQRSFIDRYIQMGPSPTCKLNIAKLRADRGLPDTGQPEYIKFIGDVAMISSNTGILTVDPGRARFEPIGQVEMCGDHNTQSILCILGTTRAHYVHINSRMINNEGMYDCDHPTADALLPCGLSILHSSQLINSFPEYKQSPNIDTYVLYDPATRMHTGSVQYVSGRVDNYGEIIVADPEYSLLHYNCCDALQIVQ